MSQDELDRDVIKKLITELVFYADEKRSDDIEDQISQMISDPSWSNYIYHSDDFFDGEEFDVDGFIEKVSAYRPIVL